MKIEQKESTDVPISTIIYTTIGALIIVAGVTAILRLSKIMISDIKRRNALLNLVKYLFKDFKRRVKF